MWKKMGTFTPLNFEFMFVDPTFHEREQKNPGCKLKTKFYCESCNIFLSLTGMNNCFKDYHKQNLS